MNLNRAPWLAAAEPAAIFLAGTTLVTYRLTRPMPPPRVTRMVQLTNNGRQKSVRLLTDGPRLYFSEDLGGRATLVRLSTEGGETVPAPVPVSLQDQLVMTPDISLDRTQLLVRPAQAASGAQMADSPQVNWRPRIAGPPLQFRTPLRSVRSPLR